MGLTAEDFGGLVALVMIFGPVVLAIVASSAALRWMRSRAVSPVVGCVAVPIITVVSIFVGWWLIPVLLGVAMIDAWFRSRPTEVPPLEGTT